MCIELVPPLRQHTKKSPDFCEHSGTHFPSRFVPHPKSSSPSKDFSLILPFLFRFAGKEFEIIDMDFSAEMPWLALPQNAFEAKKKLGEAFRVETCPMLVIIDPDGTVVTTEGVEIISKDTEGECFPWTPKPLYDLSTLEPEILGEMNDTVTLVALCEGCSEEQKAEIEKQMMPVAQKAFDEAKASGCEAGMLFFTATETSDVVYQLRTSCELGEPTSTPQLVILDIPDSGAYYVFDGALPYPPHFP